MMPRPSRDQVFIEMATQLSQRASCRRLAVGALIVRDNKWVIASGVNGPNNWDCLELSCDIEKPCQHAIHAEYNAIFHHPNPGLLRGCTLYVTHSPCLNCAKAIVSVGIRRVVYREQFRSTEGSNYLTEAGVEVLHYV